MTARYNTKTITALVLAIGEALTSAPANADAFWALGHGASYCSDFLDSMNEEHKHRRGNPIPNNSFYTHEFGEYIEWVNGFISAINILTTDPAYKFVGQHTDAWGAGLWLEQYCRNHRADRFYDAVNEYRNDLLVNGR